MRKSGQTYASRNGPETRYLARRRNPPNVRRAGSAQSFGSIHNHFTSRSVKIGLCAFLTAIAGIAEDAPPASRLKIGVVQMAPAPTLAANKDRIVARIAEVAAGGARVAVFPEDALAGEGENDQAAVEAGIEAVRHAAQQSSVCVLLGGRSRHAETNRTSRWLHVIGPDGRDLLRCDKLFDIPLSPMPGLFAIDGVPCSALLCADRWLRGVQEVPVQLGAKVCFELSCNYANEWVAPFGWYWNVPQAMRNNVWVVFANTGNTVSGVSDSGAAEDLRHGHSAVIAPNGRIVTALQDDVANILLTEIEVSEATRAEALARAAHPALRGFWDAGAALHRGETVDAPELVPVKFAAAAVTLAASTVTGDATAMAAKVLEARAMGADLITFPAEAIEGSALPALQVAAKENQLAVVFGAQHHEGDSLRNSAFVIGPDGTVLTRYDQLSARAPYAPGINPAAMNFRVKGLPAVVTVGRDALWSELPELAAVAGARIHVHLDNDSAGDPEARQRRLQVWANLASFRTFSVTANVSESMIWDDLSAAGERRGNADARPSGGDVEVFSPFSANLVAQTSPGTSLVVATRTVSGPNPHYAEVIASKNPKMAPWFRLGASLLATQTESPAVPALERPYQAGTFRGRIAWSADGNHNDPDDWAASPVALAIFAAAGLKDKVVHFDYNCILPETDADWEKTHADSVLGAAKRYGYDEARFFDCRRNLDGALSSLVEAIAASSATDPLYFVIAGPMGVPFRAIEKSDPSKRQFVYCISHSRWNDGYASNYKFTCTKRSVIEQDVHWTQIRDQNERLSFGRYGQPSAPEDFSPYFWMRDSRDEKVKFLWERMLVSTRPDPSDAGMAWFLVTGDEECDPVKLKRLLDDHQVPPPVTARRLVRLEAENFRHIEGFAVDDRKDKGASHQLSLVANKNTGRIRTRVGEPFMCAGKYEAVIRYHSAPAQGGRFTFFINGTPRGSSWTAAAGDSGWASQTVSNVDLRIGDEIRVDIEGPGSRLDFVQFNLR
jgi:predicted amidohydrolase